MNSIAAELQSLEPTAEIELFELHAPSKIYRFHAGTNELFGSVVWRGQEYLPFPIQAEGFSQSSDGTMPRPTLRVANIKGLVSQILLTDDITGYKVVRRMTMAKFLDAVNFIGGKNPSADPESEYPQEIFFVSQRKAETKSMVEFELASVLELDNVQLPLRQIIQNACTWQYRSAQCGYTGGPCATIHDTPTSDPAQDQCGKRLSSCKLRHGTYSVLPFGGFPAAGLFRV